MWTRMWSFPFIIYLLYKLSIHWMQSSPKCRFPWMSTCPRFPLRLAPTRRPRSQRISCLQHYNSLMFTQLLRGKKSLFNICAFCFCLSNILSSEPKYMHDKWCGISLSPLETLLFSTPTLHFEMPLGRTFFRLPASCFYTISLYGFWMLLLLLQ